MYNWDYYLSNILGRGTPSTYLLNFWLSRFIWTKWFISSRKTFTISQSHEFNDMLSNSTFSLNSFSLFVWTMLAFNALFYLILFCYAVYIYYFRKPASPPSAPEYEMNTAHQNSNSNISEIQNLLNKNPNILNDLVKLIDHTSKSNQPLALARFN